MYAYRPACETCDCLQAAFSVSQQTMPVLEALSNDVVWVCLLIVIDVAQYCSQTLEMLDRI